METRLKLIPINEVAGTQNEFTITLKQVEHMAEIATNLEPSDSFSKIDGYTNALWEEMQSRKFSDKDLFTAYDKLIHATNGFSLLKATIQLLLLEQTMRIDGIDNSAMNAYNGLQREYQYLINDLKI
jgi:hypothetical protein